MTRNTHTTTNAARWQALQARLSQLTPAMPGAWSRRSSVICKWHALPASVSARASWARA